MKHKAFERVLCFSCYCCCFPDMYLLSESPESYHYLSQSGCVQDSSLDDKQLFHSVMVKTFSSPVTVCVKTPEGAIRSCITSSAVFCKDLGL